LKKYVDLVLKKAKKPLSIEKVYEKVEALIKKDDDSYLGLDDSAHQEIKNILDDGVLALDFIKTTNNDYVLIGKTSFRKGYFRGNRKGDGKVLSTSSYIDRDGCQVVKTDSYEVLCENANGAIDGDIVLIDIGNSLEASKVIKIIERNLDYIAGEVYSLGNSYFVRPIDKRKQGLKIAIKGEAIDGERVAVRLVEQSNDDFYIGEIVRVFNHKDDPDEDILWEAFKCGIDDKFSDEALKQVVAIPSEVRDVDKIGRFDFTDWQIVTIDGEDTKDIDDAVSCKRLDNGNLLVGVHIADVSYYVEKGSPLDKDAFKRATSHYLAGKVIPMLPHKLSNGICSLNPGVLRLAMSCVMEVNPQGNVVNHMIGRSVIKSGLKMNYTKVNALLKEGKADDEYREYASMLNLLKGVTLRLRRNRLSDGAVEFDRPELKLILDEDGKVKDFSIREQDVAENLIEELMLLANETVDKHLSKLGFPCLHRIHDTPNEERLVEFFKLLEAVDYPFYKYSSSECANTPKALQELVGYVKNTGELSMVLSTNLIKCLSRAKYSPNNIGHSGLAKEFYCHYTSPIRRYPDLVVHRILTECCFDSENALKNARSWNVMLPSIAEHCSKMEKVSDEAEIQTLVMKCCEYMEGHIGESFEAMIIGLSQHGIQVQLDNMVEGKVRIRNLDGEYVYNPETYTLVALNKGANYYIGDRLLVQLVDASKENKTIDFKVLKKIVENRIEDNTDSNQYIRTMVKMKRAH